VRADDNGLRPEPVDEVPRQRGHRQARGRGDAEQHARRRQIDLRHAREVQERQRHEHARAQRVDGQRREERQVPAGHVAPRLLAPGWSIPGRPGATAAGWCTI
jgi:hypothetical protein